VPRRPPLSGDEKSTLHAALALHRAAALWKIEGLDDHQVRRAMVPSGTNLLGLLKHLAGVEYEWLVKTFGRPAEPLETDPVQDMNAGQGETTEDVVAFYRRACAAADEVIEQLDLDALGTAWFGEPVSLRRALVGVIYETARHTGHMDILRELTDGSVGSDPPD